MHKSLIVANWKMDKNIEQASLFVHHFEKVFNYHRSIETVLAPSLLVLQPLSLQIDHRKLRLAAQNAYYRDKGPYTGEVSFTQLAGLVDYAIIGHSERRIYFNESLELIRDKVAAAIRNGINPILCLGESKPERQNGETKRVIHDQLVSALANLTADEVKMVTIAYEPVWAISTFGGEEAKPEDIQKMLDYIRYQIKELYGEQVSQAIRVLYGGSVDADSASRYLELEGCDGALVGAASLDHQSFADIIDKAYQVQQSKKPA